jgi:hypothetical protein
MVPILIIVAVQQILLSIEFQLKSNGVPPEPGVPRHADR